MTAQQILQELEALGNPQTKKVLAKHGAREPFFGVKVADLKKIVKKVKKNHELALELYDTGNSDAMYLAALIADELKMDEATLQKWAEKAYWYYLSEYAVAWVAAESHYGWKLGLEWIESDQENMASCGWATLANFIMIRENYILDISKLVELLDRVGETLHQARNRVRYAMNGFIIAVGSSISPLTKKALEIAAKVGKVHVDMGGTACKVPMATDYIQKVIDKGRLGVKKKQARC